MEPPNVCGFCEGKSVKRDLELPEEGFTCGDGNDFIIHFASNVACDAPNTGFGEAEEICCGEALEQGSGSDSAASFVGTGVFVAFMHLFFGVSLA